MAWAFQSSHLMYGDYDPSAQSMTVQFANGAIYLVSGIPQTEVDNFRQSSSAGSYWHDKIKTKYRITKIASGNTKSGRRSQRKW